MAPASCSAPTTAAMAERQFMHDEMANRFSEVIERQENGWYLCAYMEGYSVSLRVTPNWSVVGLSEATAGRLRGATVYTKTQAAMEE